MEVVKSWLPTNLLQPCVNEALKQIDAGPPDHRYMFGLDLGKIHDSTVLVLNRADP